MAALSDIAYAARYVIGDVRVPGKTGNCDLHIFEAGFVVAVERGEPPRFYSRYIIAAKYMASTGRNASAQ
jgi:hypothetical protein